MPYRSGINWAMLLAACAAAPACTSIPSSVKDGTELPPTLEMCHAMLVDANDSNYLLRAQLKHTKAD